MPSFRRATLPLTFLLASSFIIGCGAGTIADSGPEPGLSLRGHIFGGQQPVQGSHIYLFAANTTGYGGNGFPASSTNASISLLSPASTGASDALGAYVLSDALGNFSITGDYVCTAGQQVYVLARGGNSGSGANAEIAEAALLGACPTGGTFLASIPYIAINELSTVAAAYSLAGFATDATHVSSSGTAPALVGIRNAFANAGNLVSLADGTALATTPAGNGIVPQAEINTLGNILAACINSADVAAPASPSTSCQSLFAAAPTSTDTFTAALAIAHNPASNISDLCGLQSPQAPFQPGLACSAGALPTDFNVAIVFTDSNIGGGPGAIVIDSQGNAIISGDSAIVKLTPLGSPFLGSPFPGSASFDTVVDLQDNIWSLVPASGIDETVLTGRTPDGAVLPGTPFSFPSMDDPTNPYSSIYGLQVDGNGVLWTSAVIGFSSSLSAVRLDYSGTAITLTPYMLNDNVGDFLGNIRFDSSQNLWAGTARGTVDRLDAGTHSVTPNFPASAGSGYGYSIDRAGNFWANNTSNVQSVSPTGTVTTFTPANYGFGFDMQFDGDNTLWVPNRNGSFLQRFTDAGVAISPGSGYTNAIRPQYIAIDASGDVWVTDNADATSSVTELIGAAGPVATPMALAVKHGNVSNRP